VARLLSPQSTSGEPTQQRRADSERELFLAIASGGEGWRERAFDEFHGLVHGLLLKTLGPRAEISDLVPSLSVSSGALLDLF
jgi:hypothetical protein